MIPSLDILTQLLSILSRAVSASNILFHEPNELLSPEKAAPLEDRLDDCVCQSGLANLHMRLLREKLDALARDAAGDMTANQPPRHWQHVLSAFDNAQRLLERSLLREAFLSGRIFPRQSERGGWQSFETMALTGPPKETPNDLLCSVTLRTGWRVEAINDYRAQFVLLDPTGRKRVNFSYEDGTPPARHSSFRMLPRYEVVQSPAEGSNASLPGGSIVTVMVVDHATNMVLHIAGEILVPGQAKLGPYERFPKSERQFDAALSAARTEAREWLEGKFGTGSYVSNECWDFLEPPGLDSPAKPTSLALPRTLEGGP
jgi:hypothetical protein